MNAIEESEIHLIVGLGNPGTLYRTTRHNLGFLTLDDLATKWGFSFKTEARFNGELSKGERLGKVVYLLKPNTFMNLSGFSLKKCMQFYKIKREKILVISDDAALRFGCIRLKPTGGSGGHNGLKHIQGQIGMDYARLRMGIGIPDHGTLESYVLENFNLKEMDELGAFIGDAVHVVESWLDNGLQAAMNQANERKDDHK